MTKLAKLFYICNEHVPYKGVGGQVEELFEARDSTAKSHGTSKYDRIFNEQEINKDLGTNHIVLKYLSVWNLYQILRELRNNSDNSDYAYFEYSQYFVLADAYKRLYDWKALGRFTLSWKSWADFIRSSMFSEAIWKYAQPAFHSAREMIPKGIEMDVKRKTERQFFRDRSALEEFERRTTKLPFLNPLKKAYAEFYIHETS